MLVEHANYNKKYSNQFYHIMKRFLLMFVALLTAIGSFADGKYVTVDGLKFLVDTVSKEATLTANSYSGDIKVPEKFADEGVEYTVTAFADECFKGCKSLTSVSIPPSVTSLGDYCFRYCSGLTSITIPSSVTSLGDWCFDSCSGLTSVSIPSSVTSLRGCFDGCKSLTSVSIPSSVTSLGEYCFSKCSYLKSVTIPSSVTSLGASCFEECPNLANISIPSSVTSLGDACFMGCSGLTSITIPTSVTSLGSACFYCCSGLKSISIPSSVKSLGYRCFYGCYGLKNITIPPSVASLGKDCFWDCDGLTSISIPSSVTELPEYCFYGCSYLKDVVIPSSVTSIAKYCFGGCGNLENITCKNPTPPILDSYAFDKSSFSWSTLYVPDVDAYKIAGGWNSFEYIKKISSGDDDKPLEPCAKPTIGYADGQLMFTDATEGAKYHYTLTCSDAASDKYNEDGCVNLAACYDISVYATADGYKPSDKATAKLYWVKADGSLTTTTSTLPRCAVWWLLPRAVSSPSAVSAIARRLNSMLSTAN